jgi:uncharacterized membrane protein
MTLLFSHNLKQITLVYITSLFSKYGIHNVIVKLTKFQTIQITHIYFNLKLIVLLIMRDELNRVRSLDLNLIQMFIFVSIFFFWSFFWGGCKNLTNLQGKKSSTTQKLSRLPTMIKGMRWFQHPQFNNLSCSLTYVLCLVFCLVLFLVGSTRHGECLIF